MPEVNKARREICAEVEMTVAGAGAEIVVAAAEGGCTLQDPSCSQPSYWEAYWGN